MDKCKIKAIQTDLGTFRHNQAYPGIIQAYSDIFKTLCNPGIFRTVVYPESLHIQNPGVFRTPEYTSCKLYTMKRFAKIFNSYSYLRKL